MSESPLVKSIIVAIYNKKYARSPSIAKEALTSYTFGTSIRSESLIDQNSWYLYCSFSWFNPIVSLYVNNHTIDLTRAERKGLRKAWKFAIKDLKDVLRKDHNKFMTELKSRIIQ